MKKKSANIADKIIPWVFTAAVLFIWELAVDKGLVARFILPSPRDVIIALFSIAPEIYKHLLITLREAFWGLFLSISLAVILAVLMDSFTVVKKAVYPLIIITQTIPSIVLAPLFALWFGFGELPKILVVMLVCFFPIAISLIDGLDSIDPDLLHLFTSMGARRFQVYRHLKLPACLINFFSGARIAATYCIMGAVIAEWLGGEAGLGVYMIRVKQSYALDKVFAVIFIVILLSMTLLKFIDFLQAFSMPWQRTIKNSTEGIKNA